jgi:beta-glucanase (GH16 family)
VPGPLGIKGNWNLVLNSTFSGSSLNTSIWRTGWFGNGITGPVGSEEQACYSPNNVTFPGDGSMHLRISATPSTCNNFGEALSEPFMGATVSTNPNDGRTSGGFQYTYGVVQARMYLPGNSKGLVDWPAFWAVGQSWPKDGEDDIMEGLQDHACFHYHSSGNQNVKEGGPGGCDMDIDAGWHTFASDWTPNSVTYYYDGEKVGEITQGITGTPEYIVLQMTTFDASWNSPTRPATARVAYVRVWQALSRVQWCNDVVNVFRASSVC